MRVLSRGVLEPMAANHDRPTPGPPRPHFHANPSGGQVVLDFPWAYPDVPPGTGEGVDLIRTSSEFAAEALRRAGVLAEIVVVPPAVTPADFARPGWDPYARTRIDCRHVVWGGPVVLATPQPLPKRRKGLLSRVYRKVFPRLSPETIDRIVRAKAVAVYFAARPSPKAVALKIARAFYWRFIRRWLNPEAIARIGQAKRAARERAASQEPPPPSSVLELEGVVYGAAVDPLDPAYNHRDLLTAFLLAFRDRDDVTLVVELVGDADQRPKALAALRDEYRSWRIEPHCCRVAVIAEDLDPNRAELLRRALTFGVSASRAENGSLPYSIRALAGGRPLLAPDHTALGDWMDGEVGFVLGSTPEPAPWPNDPAGPLATSWNRLIWSELREAFRESAAGATEDLARYRAMSEAARSRAANGSRRVVETLRA